MTLGAVVWTLDAIQFHHSAKVRDDHGVQWILTEEKGFWGTPGTGATLSPRLNKHGVYRSPGWKKERTVSLTGRCYAEDRAVLRQAEADVAALLSDPTRPGTLTCHSELGALALEVFLDAPILCTPLDIMSEPGYEFSLQLVAPDPRKYTVEEQESHTGLPADVGVGGLDFLQVIDAGVGLDFSAGLFFGVANARGFMVLRNAGTAPTAPIYTLYGPLDSPTLASDGGSLRYNATIPAGQFVVIDPSAPSVLLGGTASRREKLNPANFEALTIPAARDGEPGELTVGLTHAGPLGYTGHVQARYRNAWF